MPAPGYLQVSDLRTMLRAVTDHTRPAFDTEILFALNYGYQTVVRAITSVRSQFFVAVVDPFTIPAATSSPPPAIEIDIGGITPPLWRPIRLVATKDSATRGAIFRYRSIVAMETIGSEQQAYSGGYNCFYYDILSGQLPGTPTQRASVMRLANPTSQAVTGRLYYQYRPKRFTDFDDFLDPIMSDWADLIVHYAISQYLLAVNDADSNAWLQKAQLLRSELMQDMEPMSGDSNEGLGSDLWGTD